MLEQLGFASVVVFWVVIPSGLTGGHFRGTHCLIFRAEDGGNVLL
jgi:hypothetical protein